MDEKKPDLLVLYSGGLDSTLLLKLAVELGYTPFAMMVRYGQKHIEELNYARNNCEAWSIPFQKVCVSLPDTVRSALTTGEHGLYEGVSEWHVPGRNLIFLGLAVSMAESLGIRKIWFGANGEDRLNQFVDCTQEWVYHANLLLKESASIPIELEAPLLGMRKETVLNLAAKLGITEEGVYSGYEKK